MVAVRLCGCRTSSTLSRCCGAHLLLEEKQKWDHLQIYFIFIFYKVEFWSKLGAQAFSSFLFQDIKQSMTTLWVWIISCLHTWRHYWLYCIETDASYSENGIRGVGFPTLQTSAVTALWYPMHSGGRNWLYFPGSDLKSSSVQSRGQTEHGKAIYHARNTKLHSLLYTCVLWHAVTVFLWMSLCKSSLQGETWRRDMAALHI